MKTEYIRCEELLPYTGLDYVVKGSVADAVCPFCSGNKTGTKQRRTLHFDLSKDMWRCPKCKTSGSALRFYAMYIKGIDLPLDSDEKGKLGDELREFVGQPTSSEVNARPFQSKAPVKYIEIPVAPDDDLHVAYSALLELPQITLTKDHRRKLLNRGLKESDIVRNGYRSLPHAMTVPEEIRSIYRLAGGDERRAEICGPNYPKNRILAGLYIAKLLQQMDIKLQGIPGFFRFGDHWCLKYTPGILIPTRNMLGQIVVCQVRLDNPNAFAKYVTLSCGSYPDAVNGPVSRCHFPLSNQPLNKNTVLLLTEGPLKADVAMTLIDRPVAFVAIQGVDNTKDLFEKILPYFEEIGITQIFNALDMDKLTNPNVQKGNANIAKACTDRGITFKDLFWGAECAEKKLHAFKAFARLRNIPFVIPETASVFEALQIVANAVLAADYDICRYKTSEGNDKKYYWDNDTKGIDDCLAAGPQAVRL